MNDPNQKLLLITLLFQILFVCSNHALHFSYLHERQLTEERSENVCLTPGCAEAAANIRDNLDENIDPCEDFYQFACGGWMKRREVPADKSEVSTFSDTQDDLDSRLTVLLEEPVTESEPNFVKLVKTLYMSCLDVNTIDALQGGPVIKALNTIGGWPVVLGDGWDESKFDWVDTLIKFRDMGLNHNILMRTRVKNDAKINTNHIITLEQPTFGIPGGKSYYSRGFNDSAISAYFDYMVRTAVKLDADKEVALKELKDAYTLEEQIANFTLPRNQMRNMSKLYNKLTVKQLQEAYPEINWMKYFKGLLKIDITENEPVIVTVPSFVEKFSKLIGNTNKRTVANYLVWRAMKDSMPLLSKEWRDISKDYVFEITGKSQEEPRKESCLVRTAMSLDVALGAYYVRNFFKEDSKSKAVEMVQYIRNEFLKVLENIDWMDSSTKEKAIEKAKSITPYIGYPEELLNDTLVSEVYPNLVLDRNSYFDNVLKLTKFATDTSYNNLRKPVIKKDWKENADTSLVNAFYNPMENSIVFLAGILQNAFFSQDRPNYLNFGSIGVVIGHEIVHGFDDRGKQYDKDGSVKNWWDPVTDEKFKLKKQCIIDQYSNYTLPEVGLQVNGVNTQGENIADNGGVKEAYNAYLSWVADNGPEGSLPDLKYTPQQLFWISTANVWCTKSKPETMKHLIFTNSHTPPKFRVIGPLSNAPQFSEDFNCPVGSSMNPEKKCQIW